MLFEVVERIIISTICRVYSLSAKNILNPSAEYHQLVDIGLICLGVSVLTGSAFKSPVWTKAILVAISVITGAPVWTKGLGSVSYYLAKVERARDLHTLLI